PAFTARRPIQASASTLPTLFLRFPPAIPTLHSFPTRRSSDLQVEQLVLIADVVVEGHGGDPQPWGQLAQADRFDPGLVGHAHRLDRKSTRLNSSHGSTSYAVFCLQKQQAAAPAGSKAPSRA